MFLEIAIGAIGIGIVLMIGFLVISQVRTALPTPQVTNVCLGRVGSDPDCLGLDNTSATIDNAGFVTGTAATQATVFAGFSLVAVGIIVLAAFGLINIFK
ncbi:hypothetical protein IIC68_03620 [archaeon]|nr:hypothetical protein [archaeon]